jgi:uncharacterized membrane protein
MSQEMSNHITTEVRVVAAPHRHPEQRNPLIGLVAFLAVFAAFGSVFVEIVRHDVVAVVELGVVAVACGVLSMVMARVGH